MWTLKFIPDWIFYALLLTGIAGLVASAVLKFIPFISQYRLPIQLVGVALTAIGLYMSGAVNNNAAWLARVAELEKKVAVAEAKSAKANSQLANNLVQSQARIAAANTATKQAIAKNSQAINRDCRLSSESVQLYNQAVKGSGQ